jgi:hypothetical protein
MGRWVEVPVIMKSIKDEDKMASLGLSDSDMEVRTLVKPAMLDLDRVESYARMIDEDGESLETETDVWLHSGGYMILQMPFREFHKLIIGKVKV